MQILLTFEIQSRQCWLFRRNIVRVINELFRDKNTNAILEIARTIASEHKLLWVVKNTKNITSISVNSKRRTVGTKKLTEGKIISFFQNGKRIF